MSSSAEASQDPLGWQAFRTRAVVAEVEILSPAAELGAALQRHRRDLDAERAANRNALSEAVRATAGQAVLVHQLAEVLSRNEKALVAAGLQAVHRELRILKDQMLDALRSAGLEVVDPLREPFHEVVDEVQVDGWRHGPEFSGEVVAETVEPIIRHGGVAVRTGRVIMGAPGNNCSEEKA